MIVRCVSRGGLVKEVTVVEIAKDRKVVVRWSGGAGLWEFMLAHGGQAKRQASDWKWRIQEDDLRELQDMARDAGVEFVRAMPVPDHARKPRAPKEPAVDPRQASLFRGRQQ